MDNNEKLAALTNEPIVVELGEDNTQVTLRRPTIGAYKKIRTYITEQGIDEKNPSSDPDKALEFGVYFIATLIKEPQMSQEQLEDIMLITDLKKLPDIMQKMGFMKPQTSPVEKVQEKSEEKATPTGADSTPVSSTEPTGA